MSLLQEVIIEMAAGGVTSAHAVAGFRMGIGGPGSKKQRRQEEQIRRRLQPVGNFYTMKLIGEGEGEEQKFDPADVVSKLAQAEKKANNDEETKTFALEDEHGNVVKVTVANDDAEDFENALAHALHGDEDERSKDGENNTAMEIAEILFKLKDRFTIVDVVWPEVEEDQEEDATMANDETMSDMAGEEGMDDEGLDDEGLEGEGELDGEDMEAGDAEGDEYDQATALSQVIDLLKAQQDATRAEAEARKAEAEAKTSEHERDASIAKVRQEEQILDMEAFYKKDKDANKEAKTLASLARWKHDMSGGDSTMPDRSRPTSSASAMEQEEDTVGDVYGKIDQNDDDALQPGEFIKYLFKYLRDR